MISWLIVLIFATGCAARGQDVFTRDVWASGAVTMLEDPANGTNRAGFTAPASLASDYNFEMPAALPASTRCLEVTTGGVIQYAAAACGTGGGSSSGPAGEVQVSGGSGTFTSDPLFFWDNATKRLGVGSGAPNVRLHLAEPAAGAGIVNVERIQYGNSIGDGGGFVFSNTATSSTARLYAHTSGASNVDLVVDTLGGKHSTFTDASKDFTQQ